MEKWLDWADLIDHLVTTVAVLVGGIWAYFKYVRGRTFASRAEVAVSGALYAADQQHVIKATAALKNTGASKLALERQGKVIRVFKAYTDTSSSSAISWERLDTVPIFEAHGWIESSETVTDEVLIVIPISDNEAPGPPLAYKLEAMVFGRMRRIRKGGVKWTGDTILPATLTPVSTDEPRHLDGSNKAPLAKMNRQGTVDKESP